MTKRGVYFLANDRVSELALTFLNSFRFHNPDLELCMIPYDANYQSLVSLKDKYNFSIFKNANLLEKFDEISRVFYPKTVGEFRKLAAWFGPIDEFFYIDIDTVVTMPLDPIYAYLQDYALFNSHSNIPAIRQFTWKDSIFSTEALTAEQIAYSANMGFFASKKGVFGLEQIEAAVRQSAVVAPHMETLCTDQPFMNFLFVTSGQKYTSLHSLRESRQDWTIPSELWAGDPNWRVENMHSYYYGENLTPVLLVHWAGQWAPTPEDIDEWNKSQSETPDRPRPFLRSKLPNKALWEHYRNLELPLPLIRASRPSPHEGRDRSNAGPRMNGDTPQPRASRQRITA